MGFIDSLYKEIGESDLNQDVTDWIDTGLVSLNMVLSGNPNCGVPVGRITEISGSESSGKTFLLSQLFINTQKMGGLAILLDYEHAFSVSRGIDLGLDTDKRNWIYKQPETAEEGFNLIESICKKVQEHKVDRLITIGIDSIPAMPTKQESEISFDEFNMKTMLGLPLLLSNALKKIASIINKTNVSLVLINQLRDNPGVMYGPKEKTTGGRALKFYCSMRLKLSKTGKIDEDKKIIGETVKVVVQKNKVADPFGECEYDYLFSSGIDFVGTHIAYADSLGLLGDTKGWVEWDGRKMRKKELTASLSADGVEYEKFLNMLKEKCNEGR